jgi:hypothetical protein
MPPGWSESGILVRQTGVVNGTLTDLEKRKLIQRGETQKGKVPEGS